MRLIHYLGCGIYRDGWHILFPLPFGFNFKSVNSFIFFRRWACGFFCVKANLHGCLPWRGALMWELMPKIFAHIGAGHITLIYAVAWTPWLLLAEIRHEKTKFPYWGAIVLTMIVLADIRWAVYAGLLWLAFSA